MNPLEHKKIAVIGCGTIGSHLSKFIAQTGAGTGTGTLTLIDNQSLSAANIGRHLLGIEYMGQNKAIALSHEIKRHLPDVNVRAISDDAWRSVRQLDLYDLVIDATGEESLSISINEYFIDRRFNDSPTPAVLHIWLSGRGDAAQMLLVHSKEFACYKCLSPDFGGTERYSPLLSDYNPKGIPAACGDSAYMPYGVGSPAIAAGLANVAVVDWATSNGRPHLRTIPINSRTTKNIGDGNPKRNERCPACGKR
jgi:molybdopterin/thiamine biosynthesis adenylyltransferase